MAEFTVKPLLLTGLLLLLTSASLSAQTTPAPPAAPSAPAVSMNAPATPPAVDPAAPSVTVVTPTSTPASTEATPAAAAVKTPPATLAAPAVTMPTPNLLVDTETGQVIYAEEADHPWHPASTTKLMTAYLTFEALRDDRLKLNDGVLQSERSLAEPPSKIGLPVGLGMSVELALQALIVKSANDVAMMLAEKVGGTMEGFVAMMNATAKRLGMSETHFVNPNGLHAKDQVTSARDLARLAIALLRDFPEQNDRYKQYYMNIGKRKLHSYNSLLRSYEGADGMKTGFICASGYNIVASASRNGHRLVAVVLGARNVYDRAARARRMFDYGFQYFDWTRAVAGNAAAVRLDSMPIGAEGKVAPSDMRSVVCGGSKVVGAPSVKKKSGRRRGGQHRPSKMRPRHR